MVMKLAYIPEVNKRENPPKQDSYVMQEEKCKKQNGDKLGRKNEKKRGDTRCFVSSCFHLSPVLSGSDAKILLQGLMTNDMALLDKDQHNLPCISAAFLNPKVT